MLIRSEVELPLYGKKCFDMGNGLNYVLRLLKGENPQSVIESMPEEDYSKLQAAKEQLKVAGLNRQQRRKMERKMNKIKR